MKRSDALILSKIYGIEKEQKRSVYSGDLANSRVLPKAKCQGKLEELRDGGFLEETVERGANMYRVTQKGVAQMSAYRDIKIELEKAAANA